MQVDASTAPAAHTPSWSQRLAVVAKDISSRQPHISQPMHRHTKHVKLFRVIRF